jgi:hypothetical protein
LSDSRKDIRATLKRLRIAADHRARTNEQITKRLLVESANIREPNFHAMSGEDVRFLFDRYDELYFDGLLNLALGATPIGFRVSSRMTRAGGKTSSWRKDKNSLIERFEITISSTLLSQTFCDDQIDRTVRVTGLECHTRLEALLRVMEHELIHLSELLGWESSSCTQDRFQTLAWQIFGHTDHRHALITPRERAASVGVRPGARVRFDFQGEALLGIVNRVTRRATVLVPAEDGDRFSDGNRYRKYYVPVKMLEPIEE